MQIYAYKATEDDVYDVVFASSSYLYTFWQIFSSSKSTNSPSTLHGFTTCCVIENRDDLGKYARLVQELRLGSDSFHRYFRMSTEQFDYVLGLVGLQKKIRIHRFLEARDDAKVGADVT